MLLTNTCIAIGVVNDPFSMQHGRKLKPFSPAACCGKSAAPGVTQLAAARWSARAVVVSPFSAAQ